MAQPVKLSDVLVLDARIEGAAQQRSIAGQVEYWARLGKLVDALIDGRTRSERLQQGGAKPLSELVAAVGGPAGDARLQAVLAHEPFPHFAAHPTRKGLLIRTEADGTRALGRFIDRKFVAEPMEPAAQRSRKRRPARRATAKAPAKRSRAQAIKI
jgi:hypothetical protein